MGNPLTSEGAAFRWFLTVLVAAVSVGIVAKIFGSTPGIFYGMFLLTIVSVVVAKGMVHLLGNPENDEPAAGEDPKPGTKPLA
ncbi:MAG: hypothetical protein ACSLFD_10580 [Solirubrobacterales bacterium]